MGRLAALMGAAALITGGAVGAAVADPGPHHGNNKHGLCTAYFNGSDKGMEKKRNAPPFLALVKAAEEAHPNNKDTNPDNDVRGEAAVREYCGGTVGGAPDRRF